MKTIHKIIMLITAMTATVACDYLDIVPDNVATIDYAFRNRTEAEKYLYTCYSYRPQIGDLFNDPAMTGGDETWQYYPVGNIFPTYTSSQIGRGYQNANNPYLDFWDGQNGGKALWRGIRDCNIFLENIDKVVDLPEYEKIRWIAEVKFLKAYYHYYLFKCYGPIPIIDVNLPISTDAEAVRVYREPVDKVVAYINDLLLEAAEQLPYSRDVLQGTEAGRADNLIAKSIRAELLLFAASPLFNGNTDYSGIIDRRGEQLFNQTYDAAKWQLAADACKEAIDACHEQQKALFDLLTSKAANAPEQLKLQTTYRQAITERWNKELIWGNTNNDCNGLSTAAHPRIVRLSFQVLNNINSQWAPTLKMAEMYYSSNGVPVEEDKEWAGEWYQKRYEIRPEPSSGDEIYYVKEGQKTVYLHYNREPRFYASIGFDRGIYYGSGYWDFPGNVKHCEFINLEYSGFQGGSQYSITGYAAKKMHSIDCTVQTNETRTEYFPFPIMRLANLYLMYAEALNEAAGPNDEIFTYLDLVRARAGLKGVKESWTKYSSRPDKPNTKDGLRDIIRRERTIELAFEGKRFWDIRRWKQINELNNQPMGWNVQGETPEDFYKPVTVARVPVEFTVKDYLWPVRESSIITNRNLIQNYGW
ncbi:MAG: RagB/SusD family nutrient uptake outer membrane protein [Tannerella sp.]|nr:RagB/SusD family nutrient uptake outer membrane protein [Tannerella sp.]